MLKHDYSRMDNTDNYSIRFGELMILNGAFQVLLLLSIGHIFCPCRRTDSVDHDLWQSASKVSRDYGIQKTYSILSGELAIGKPCNLVTEAPQKETSKALLSIIGHVVPPDCLLLAVLKFRAG
ncbi:hypothetical protein OSTOST_04037 [Ostertagia ostertagi]